MKKCSACGTTKDLKDFAPRRDSKDGVRNDCRNCHREVQRSYRAANLTERIEYQRKWNIANADKLRARDQRRQASGDRMWAAAKTRAKKRGLTFDLALADLHIPDVCPVLGIKLTVGVGVFHDASPSLDRIDNTKGYVRGNVVVVSHRANAIKRNATVDELRTIANYYERLAQERQQP